MYYYYIDFICKINIFSKLSILEVWKKESCMKKNTLALAVVSVFAFGVSSANALEFSNNFCDPVTGNIAVVVQGSLWDVYYHEKVIIKARDSNMVWKEVSFNMAYPGATYSANAFSMGLPNVQQYNIATSKTTLVVSACN